MHVVDEYLWEDIDLNDAHWKMDMTYTGTKGVLREQTKSIVLAAVEEFKKSLQIMGEPVQHHDDTVLLCPRKRRINVADKLPWEVWIWTINSSQIAAGAQWMQQ